MISIPVGEFNVQKDKEVRDLLQGEYQIHGLSGATLYAHLAANDLIIIPEALGTFWLAAFAPDRTMYEHTAVVDIGYYTTDVVLMQDGAYVVGGAQSADRHGIGRECRFGRPASPGSVWVGRLAGR
jgi:hypothetical protein